jgi:predicted lipoprotein with Yx(FWY)xxD motif
MYGKKSHLWAGFSLFMLLALVMTGCSSATNAGAQSNTPVSTTAAQAPTVAATVMSTAMPAPAGSAMPTAMSTAMPVGSQPTSAVVLPTAASFTLMVGSNPKLGNYLTDQDGRTLYILVKDSSTTSNCNGACVTLWPPLIGSAAAGSGVTATMIGVVTRQDGNDQVSYNGHPLYYFSKDVNPQDVNGQGFGNGNWWVLSPSGTPINTMLSAMPASSTAMPSGMMTATP